MSANRCGLSTSLRNPTLRILLLTRPNVDFSPQVALKSDGCADCDGSLDSCRNCPQAKDDCPALFESVSTCRHGIEAVPGILPGPFDCSLQQTKTKHLLGRPRSEASIRFEDCWSECFADLIRRAFVSLPRFRDLVDEFQRPQRKSLGSDGHFRPPIF